MEEIFSAALNKAIGVLGVGLKLFLAYAIAKTLLLTRIEGNQLLHGTIQKVISCFYAIAIAALLGTISGFMFGKSLLNGIASFFIFIVISLYATFRLYIKEENKD